MTTTTTTLTDFLLACIAEDEALTWRLIPYACPPDCCAPEGFVGHECLICRETSFGGTPTAIAAIARTHDEAIHKRSRVLAECEAKRRIVKFHRGWGYDCPACEGDGNCIVLFALAQVYRDRPGWREEWAL